MVSNDNGFGVEPPKDADGKVIPLDTEILYETDGQVFHVLAFRYSTRRRKWFASGGYTGDRNGWCIETDKFLLAPPDSWDKLIGDLRRAVSNSVSSIVCAYAIPDGGECCECPVSDGNCVGYMLADIADRIEKLRGASND